MSAPVETSGGEVRVYEAADGEVRVDVRLDRETVWLTQEQMSQLFGRERSVITKHVRNAFREGELEPGATCAKFAQVQTEGDRTVTRDVDHYNLDVIISVGYRVKSVQGTRFRRKNRKNRGKIGTDTIIVTIRSVYGHDRACHGLAEPLHLATQSPAPAVRCSYPLTSKNSPPTLSTTESNAFSNNAASERDCGGKHACHPGTTSPAPGCRRQPLLAR